MSEDIIWNRTPAIDCRRSDWYKTLIELIDSLGEFETSGYHQLIIPPDVQAIFETIFMDSYRYKEIGIMMDTNNQFMLNSKYLWSVFIDYTIPNDMIYINPNSKFRTQIKVKHYDN